MKLVIMMGIMAEGPNRNFLGDVHIVANGNLTAAPIQQHCTVEDNMVA